MLSLGHYDVIMDPCGVIKVYCDVIMDDYDVIMENCEVIIGNGYVMMGYHDDTIIECVRSQ